jgi:hypothetical protein
MAEKERNSLFETNHFSKDFLILSFRGRFGEIISRSMKIEKAEKYFLASSSNS